MRLSLEKKTASHATLPAICFLSNHFKRKTHTAHGFNAIAIAGYKTGISLNGMIVQSGVRIARLNLIYSDKITDISIFVGFSDALNVLTRGLYRPWHKICNMTGGFRIALLVIRAQPTVQ